MVESNRLTTKAGSGLILGRICPRRAHPSIGLRVTRAETGETKGNMKGVWAVGSGSQHLTFLPEQPFGPDPGFRGLTTHQPCRWVEGHSNVRGSQVHT